VQNKSTKIVGVIVAGLALLGAFFWFSSEDPGGAGETFIRRLKSTFSRKGTESSFRSKDEQGPVKSAQRADEAFTSGPRASDRRPTPTFQSVRVVGILRNELRQPVAGAKVRLRLPGTVEVTSQVSSGDDGHFELQDVQPDTYDILIQHPEYASLIRPAYTITGMQSVVRMDFVLPMAARIQGKVLDEEGVPIAGAAVAARRQRLEQLPSGGNVFLDDSTYQTAETNTSGSFVLRGIGLGRNVLEVRRRGYEFATQPLDVTSTAGLTNLTVTLKRTGTIRGVVLSELDSPVCSATVRLLSYKPLGEASQALPQDKWSTTTTAKGEFAFHRLYTEGFYDLLVEHPDYAPAVYPLVAVGTERQLCRLERGGSISGRAEFIDRPTTPASVLIVAQTVTKGTTVTRATKSDGSGVFVFDRLPYGKYELTVDSEHYACEPLKDIPCNRDAPTRDVVVEVFERCRVRGRVLNAESDSPIADAKVSLESVYGFSRERKRRRTVMTNARGEFEFQTVPAGLHLAEAEARGFVRMAGGQSVQRFSLLPAERKEDLVLRLGHGGTVEGFVLDFMGRPVEGADVQLYHAATTGIRINVSNLKTKTDASGYFKIWGIEVGEQLQLYASAQKAGLAKAHSDLIQLSPEKPFATTQVVLPLGGSVTGKVLDPKNLPIAGAEVRFRSKEFPKDPSGSEIKVYTAADGSYLVEHCTPGRAEIEASKSGYVSEGRGLTITDGKRLENINIRLTPGLRISGRVITLEGKPIAGARVRAEPHKYVRGRDETLTNKNGDFTLTNLGSGLFDVRTNFTLKTPDGEQGYEFFVRDVKAGTQGLEIECDVNNSAVGSVEDEDNKPVNNFRLTLRSRTDMRPAQDFVFNFDRSLTDARGFFRILNIPRGLYTLTVIADGYEVYSKEDLVIGPSRRTIIPKIRLRAAGGVVGQVYSAASNRPVNDASVALVNPALPEEDAKRNAIRAHTDYSGFFRINTAAAGSYVLEISHPNYVPTTLQNVVVSRNRATDLGKIYLEAGGVVQGVVFDDQRYGINWAEVRVSGVSPKKETHTDSSGNYVLLGVRPGRWPLVVETSMNGRKIYAYRTIEVRPGETTREDFYLETSANVVGSIAALDAVVRSGNVHFHPFNEFSTVIEDIRYDASVSQQGFRIRSIPPGSYFLWVKGTTTVAPFTFWQTLFLERGDNPVRIELPAGAVAGRGFDRSGSPVSGAHLQLYPIIDSFGIPRSVYNSLVRSTVTQAEGHYLFPYLQAGRYQLLYYDPAGAGSGQWVAMPPFWLGANQVLGGVTFAIGQ